MKKNSVVLFILICAVMSGCSTVGQKWRELLGGGDPAPAPVKEQATNSDDLKYSDRADVPVQENKRYRRMTKEQFEKEGLTDETGSLWAGDGQGSYLFSANMVRIPGDSVSISLDGEPKKQLSQKANVLAQLLKKANRQTASSTAPPATPDPQAAGGAPAATPATAATTDKKEEKEDDSKDAFSVSNIPSRIIERVPDGSYRVRGTQTFMIGKDEYRVIASGLVKSSDITDEGVLSSKMMDPKFDIVSMRKTKDQERDSKQ